MCLFSFENNFCDLLLLEMFLEIVREKRGGKGRQGEDAVCKVQKYRIVLFTKDKESS